MAPLIDKSGSIAHYGRVSWANLVDWLVTFCLAAIVIQMALSLGGVRADSHLFVLPLFGVLLLLHGLWLAVNRECFPQLIRAPLWFLPLIAWIALSAWLWSPAEWRGWSAVVYALEGFIFLWVAVNNVRTRAHLLCLLLAVLVPAVVALAVGFGQFFQDPTVFVDARGKAAVMLSEVYHGRATGLFAAPSHLAVYLLSLLPGLAIVAAVPRLPLVLRFLAGYLVLMFVLGILLTQVLWGILLCLPIFILTARLCFLSTKSRMYWVLSLTVVLIGTASLFALFTPRFSERWDAAFVNGGLSSQLTLWKESLQLAAANPVGGAGAGSVAVALEQSPRLALSQKVETPQSDFLQILVEYGLFGSALLFVPLYRIVKQALRRARNEPVRYRLKGHRSEVMPLNRLFLSVGLSGSIVFFLCGMLCAVATAPLLILYGAFFIAILVKLTYPRSLSLPEHRGMRFSYAGIGLFAGLSFTLCSWTVLESQALESIAAERLDQLVAEQAHISGNQALLDSVLTEFSWATQLAPKNADAWIGLSVAHSLKVHQAPAQTREIGEAATRYAARATQLGEHYWRAWAQLGVAQALCGEIEAAEDAFNKAVELAPNNSNANFQWAAFMSHFPERRDEAITAVQHALDINPQNAAARRLQQKLLML
jgi:tetratricopeptide (TPR) repeat protein